MQANCLVKSKEEEEVFILLLIEVVVRGTTVLAGSLLLTVVLLGKTVVIAAFFPFYFLIAAVLGEITAVMPGALTFFVLLTAVLCRFGLATAVFGGMTAVCYTCTSNNRTSFTNQ